MSSNNEKDYAVFSNKKTGKKLVYYPVAKNANTSVKLFFIRHLGIEEKFFYLEDIPRYQHTKEMYEKNTGKYNLINFFPPYTPFKKMDVDIKCCLVRDPIKRFKSTYTNRILFHKDEKFRNFTLDEVLESLLNSKFDNRHFLPQTYWLGYDLNYYTFYFFTNKIINFALQINKFFDQDREFPILQTGGNKNILDLNNDQKNKIKKIYSSDYDFLKIIP